MSVKKTDCSLLIPRSVRSLKTLIYIRQSTLRSSYGLLLTAARRRWKLNLQCRQKKSIREGVCLLIMPCLFYTSWMSLIAKIRALCVLTSSLFILHRALRFGYSAYAQPADLLLVSLRPRQYKNCRTRQLVCTSERPPITSSKPVRTLILSSPNSG